MQPIDADGSDVAAAGPPPGTRAFRADWTAPPTADEPTPPTAGPGGALVAQVSGVVLGDGGALSVAVAAFLAGGHVLAEDMPGVGKTLLAKALARSIGGSFGRIQGTPDLLPSDLTGVSVYEEDDRHWRFVPGPLFHNVVLVDELNRTTPRTQSALLEAMAEQQVTVDGDTHPLPDPFFVIATQNPHDELLGTFPLVDGQRDRFAVSLSLGLPGRRAERQLLLGTGGEARLEHLEPVAALTQWHAERTAVASVHVDPRVADYLLEIVDTIRRATGGEHLLSPRAALALLAVARAHARLHGRGYVLPDDVRTVAVAVLGHRLTAQTEGHLGHARGWVEHYARSVTAPPVTTP